MENKNEREAAQSCNFLIGFPFHVGKDFFVCF